MPLCQPDLGRRKQSYHASPHVQLATAIGTPRAHDRETRRHLQIALLLPLLAPEQGQRLPSKARGLDVDEHSKGLTGAVVMGARVLQDLRPQTLPICPSLTHASVVQAACESHVLQRQHGLACQLAASGRPRWAQPPVSKSLAAQLKDSACPVRIVSRCAVDWRAVRPNIAM